MFLLRLGGARLFERAALHARNRGVETLFIHALSENVPMLKIARKAGARVEREGSESEAWLRLPQDTVSSHVDEAIERHMAELDFQFKRHAGGRKIDHAACHRLIKILNCTVNTCLAAACAAVLHAEITGHVARPNCFPVPELHGRFESRL